MAAFDFLRKPYLETQGQFLILVVQEQSAISVWGEDKTLERPRAATDLRADLIQQINLKKLVAQMRDIGGVPIKDRRYGLRTYPRCFLGHEAVAWFSQTLQLSSAEAIQLGQRLITEKLIHHVTDEHDFKDEELFYRFFWDEN